MNGFVVILVTFIIVGGFIEIFKIDESYDKKDLVNAYKEGMEIVLEADTNIFNADSAAMAFEINLNDN